MFKDIRLQILRGQLPLIKAAQNSHFVVPIRVASYNISGCEHIHIPNLSQINKAFTEITTENTVQN